MKVLEYTVLKGAAGDIERKLNELGAQGWDVITAQFVPPESQQPLQGAQGANVALYVLLRRQK